MSETFCHADPGRFAAAVARFDGLNAQDPHQETVEGKPTARELAYARWLTAWVLRLCPEASEPLRLAARCQHLCRWMVPRDSYPLTRPGYLKWREDLKKFHAQKAGEVLREVGYPEQVVARVQSLNLKKNLAGDPEMQVLEDALCLVFLEHQFSELAAKSTDEKMIGALQKAWKKMSPAAQGLAKRLPLQGREKQLLDRALGG